MARAACFSKSNADDFFNNYNVFKQKYNFDPNRVWNTDETCITTSVLHDPKVIAEKLRAGIQCIYSG